MNHPEVVWQTDAQLGEGPIWVKREKAVYWVDILTKKVHRYTLTDKSKTTWDFNTAVTSLAPREQGGFIGSINDGFAILDFDTSTVEPFNLPEVYLPDNRFNDGKVDATGRYWAGTMNMTNPIESGHLYRLDTDLTVHRVDENYIIANGPAFSKDGTTLYHTDTPKRLIYAFDLASNGDLSNKRVFTEFTEDDEGNPDGMTVDSEDCIWVAHFGGARITRFAPTGDVLQVVPMPVPNITSCTFAGDNLDSMYITTARLGIDKHDLHKYHQAGSLFMFKPDVVGLPTPLFGG